LNQLLRSRISNRNHRKRMQLSVWLKLSKDRVDRGDTVCSTAVDPILQNND